MNGLLARSLIVANGAGTARCAGTARKAREMLVRQWTQRGQQGTRPSQEQGKMRMRQTITSTGSGYEFIHFGF